MRRDVLWIVLGLLVGAAPLAVGQDEDDELLERLRALQDQLHRQINRQAAVGKTPPIVTGKYQLGLFPVPDITMPRFDYIRPDHRIDPGREDSEYPLFGSLTEEGPQPYGTVEELLELIRASVWPDSWNDGATINAHSGGRIIVLQTEPVLKDIRRFLDGNLRSKAHACATVEAEILSVPVELFRSLAGAATLSTAQRLSVDQALQQKTASRVFAGRVTGFVGQRQLMWHGKQVAVVPRADVEVAQDARTTDPVVEIVQAGGYISVDVRHVGETDLRLDAEVRLDELEKLDKRSTGENGTLDVPVIRTIAGRAAMRVPPRTWALIASGVGKNGQMRIVLMRATRLARGGK